MTESPQRTTPELDPIKAQVAMIGILAALGRELSWSADTFSEIVVAIKDSGVAAGLPSCTADESDDNYEADIDYWQRVYSELRA